MKSARINFGIPDSEYILEVDDTGAATSLLNQDTGTEYVGGGGGGDSVIYLGKDITETPSYNTLSNYLTNGAIVYYCKTLEEDGEYHMWYYFLVTLHCFAPDSYAADFATIQANNPQTDFYISSSADDEMVYD